MNQWISVKDRLPEDERDALVWLSTEKYEIASFKKAYRKQRESYKGTFLEWDEAPDTWYFDNDGDVTHWMPLPKPPVPVLCYNIKREVAQK